MGHTLSAGLGYVVRPRIQLLLEEVTDEQRVERDWIGLEHQLSPINTGQLRIYVHTSDFWDCVTVTQPHNNSYSADI